MKRTTAQLLDEYFANRAVIFAHFGYVEDWRKYPLNDDRDYYWFIDGGDERGGGGGTLVFSDNDNVREQNEAWEERGEGGMHLYSAAIHTDRHLSRWVWRAPRYTMVLVDTQTDMNIWLSVLDNEKWR